MDNLLQLSKLLHHDHAAVGTLVRLSDEGGERVVQQTPRPVHVPSVLKKNVQQYMMHKIYFMLKMVYFMLKMEQRVTIALDRNTLVDWWTGGHIHPFHISDR